MSNVDIVRRSYDAFSRHDMDGVMGDMHPEIVWVQAQGLPHGGTYRGLDEVKRNIFDPLDEGWWNGCTADPDGLVDAGPTVGVIGRVWGRGTWRVGLGSGGRVGAGGW